MFQYCFRPQAHTAQKSLEAGIKADGAASEAERRAIVKEFGVTGVSPFFRLHMLCNFDPVHDMVVDTMHAICLKLVRTELDHHLLDLVETKNAAYLVEVQRAGACWTETILLVL